MMTRSILLLAQAGSEPTAADTGLILWAIVLLGVAVVLFLIEVVVPSGGIIGFCSAVSMIAGIVMLFRFNTTLGLVGAILSMGAVPFLFAFALRLWPNTPIARLLLLKNPVRKEKAQAMGSGGSLGQLEGAHGEALTDLHPVGTCRINSQRYECLAEAGIIRSGSPVCVVSVDGNQIKVRCIDDE